jgi:hypothetical protein
MPPPKQPNHDRSYSDPDEARRERRKDERPIDGPPFDTGPNKGRNAATKEDKVDQQVAQPRFHE